MMGTAIGADVDSFDSCRGCSDPAHISVSVLGTSVLN
jgi:hypothetical protein